MKSAAAMANVVCASLLSLAATGVAPAATVFFDDFQDRPSVPAEVPVIEPTATGSLGDVADIGLSWDSEANNVDVVADPDGTPGSQVLQGNFPGDNSNGNMDGNLAAPIRFHGAMISVDFYVGPDGGNANDVTVRIRPVTGAGTGGIQFNVDGSVSGAGNNWTIQHFGTEIWQSAQWTYTSTGNPDEYSTSLTITERGTTNTRTETTVFTAAAGTDANFFTETNALFRGNANHFAYIDNLQVDGVPEPTTCLLGLISTIGMALSARRRR